MSTRICAGPSIAAIIVAVIGLGTVAFAQPEKYKEGDPIEYKVMGSYPERWEKGGTYVGSTPGGKQPIIREKPNEYYPQGSQRAGTWDAIRPTAKAGPVKPDPKDDPPADDPNGPADPPADDGGEGCAGMLSENDVLSFLQKKLGNNKPYDWRKKQEVENEIAGKIRACGLGFRFDSRGAYSDKLDKYDATSVVRYPLMGNMGPPTKQDWYNGTWLITAQSEDYWLIIASRAGFVTISANGTYTWKNGPNDPPTKYVKGRWRPATEEEMKVSYQGGKGIVLLSAVGGDDWLVRHNRDSRDPTPGNWVNIELLSTRQNRLFGYKN